VGKCFKKRKCPGVFGFSWEHCRAFEVFLGVWLFYRFFLRNRFMKFIFARKTNGGLLSLQKAISRILSNLQHVLRYSDGEKEE